MEAEVREQQLELLQSVVEYTPKALKELQALADEFYGIKQEDSDEYLDFVLENVNWEIEALNHTLDLLQEESESFNKDWAEGIIQQLNDALLSKEDETIADALAKGLIPLLEKFAQIAEQILGKQI